MYHLLIHLFIPIDIWTFPTLLMLKETFCEYVRHISCVTSLNTGHMPLLFGSYQRPQLSFGFLWHVFACVCSLTFELTWRRILRLCTRGSAGTWSTSCKHCQRTGSERRYLSLVNIVRNPGFFIDHRLCLDLHSVVKGSATPLWLHHSAPQTFLCMLYSGLLRGGRGGPSSVNFIKIVKQFAFLDKLY